MFNNILRKAMMHLIDKTKTPCKLLVAIHKVHGFRIKLFERYKISIALFGKNLKIKTINFGGVYCDKQRNAS